MTIRRARRDTARDSASDVPATVAVQPGE
jgi:hypothetical protein